MNLQCLKELSDKKDKEKKTIAVVREYIKKDILFFFNTFCWAYDPMADTRHGENLIAGSRPIITYPFQDEAILKIDWCIENGQNIFIDKSRDMLATYMVLYVFLWRWLTKKSQQFKIGSRKEDYVDKSGDMDSLFEKLRFNFSMLPPYIRPIGWKDKYSSYMRLINPEMASAIIGEATNKDFARAGRNTAVLFDEFQSWEMAEEAWKAATDSTRCKIPIGTPQGSGSKFAELSRTDEIKHKLHLIWYLHPEKAYTSEAYREKLKTGVNIHGKTIALGDDQSYAPSGCYVGTDGKIRSEWYDEEDVRRNAIDMAENVDCNYLTSGDPIFDTQICNANLLKCKEPIAVGNLNWKTSPIFNSEGDCINQKELTVEFVPNMNGNIKIWEHPEMDWDDAYLVSADVAEGLSQGDFDSGSVLKRIEDKPKTVASIHTKVKTFEYAEELVKLAIYYGHAIIAPERNNTMGGAVIEQIFRMYNRIFFKEIFTKGYATRTDKLGWETTSQSKGRIIGNLSKHISLGMFEDNDETFWKETITFVKSDGKLEAQGKSQGQKCYDDTIMDRAIGLWVNRELPPPKRKFIRKEYIGWRKSWNEPPKGHLITFA